MFGLSPLKRATNFNGLLKRPQMPSVKRACVGVLPSLHWWNLPQAYGSEELQEVSRVGRAACHSGSPACRCRIRAVRGISPLELAFIASPYVWSESRDKGSLVAGDHAPAIAQIAQYTQPSTVAAPMSARNRAVPKMTLSFICFLFLFRSPREKIGMRYPPVTAHSNQLTGGNSWISHQTPLPPTRPPTSSSRGLRAVLSDFHSFRRSTRRDSKIVLKVTSKRSPRGRPISLNRR